MDPELFTRSGWVFRGFSDSRRAPDEEMLRSAGRPRPWPISCTARAVADGNNTCDTIDEHHSRRSITIPNYMLVGNSGFFGPFAFFRRFDFSFWAFKCMRKIMIKCLYIIYKNNIEVFFESIKIKMFAFLTEYISDNGNCRISVS